MTEEHRSMGRLEGVFSLVMANILRKGRRDEELTNPLETYPLHRVSSSNVSGVGRDGNTEKKVRAAWK